MTARETTSCAELRKHCFPDSFNVTCAHDEVIVMTAARYGRMSKGQCLTSDYQVGCWADVLHHVDRKCSGRRHCVITIPDTVLHNLHPCQKDLFAYLESEHVCQKGTHGRLYSINNSLHATTAFAAIFAAVPFECRGNYSAASNNMKLMYGLWAAARPTGPSSLYQM